MFTLDERLEMLQDALPASEKLEVVSFGGLVVDYCKEHGHKVILRGLRTVSDFEYEYQMALTNRHLNDAVETVFVMPSVEFSFVSSSLIKDIVRNGGNVSAFVPSAIEARMRKKLLDAK